MSPAPLLRGSLWATFALSLAACEAPDAAACDPVRVSADDQPALWLRTCTGALSLGGAELADEHLPAAPDSAPAVAWAWDDVAVSMNQGRFTFAGPFGAWEAARAGIRTEDGGWVGWGPDGEAGAEARLDFAAGPEGSVRVRLSVQSPDGSAPPDRVSLAFGCRDGEHFYGLGARPEGTEHRGKKALLYASEPGIGQGEYPLDEADILRGRIGDSYFPVPFTVTDRGVGIGVGGTPVVSFGLCGAEEPGVLRVEAWDSTLDLYLWPGGSPRETVAAWTLAAGTPAPAPPWAYGPWIAVQRGTEELLRVADLLRDEGIPASALWAQDWIGGREQAFGGYDLYYHWTWDEAAYPALPAAIDTLHADGFAFLGYFNPFVTRGFPEWDQAVAGGYLIHDEAGADYEFRIVDREGSQVDLFQPEAFDWAAGFLRAAVEMGQDGWMCDFAEWLPFDARVGLGERGADLHNAYPLVWQDLNRSVLDEGLGEGRGLCFNRSGWAGTAQRTAVTWGGDQETGWGRDDGFPTAREIGVGLGLSGVGRYGSDIAGFTSVWDDPSTRELYFRWVELGAFEPVMRTHDGLSEAENWSWERDDESLAHFRTYARWHMRLQPLWLALDRQYRQEGLPFLRHSILVADQGVDGFDELRDAPDQHFLGDDLLVAPVLEEGATARAVVLPPGDWVHLLTGERFEGGSEGATVVIDAPLGTTPILQRAGTAFPLAPERVQSSFDTASVDVVDMGDVGGDLDWIVTHEDGGIRSIELADGSTWSVQGTGSFDSAAPAVSDGLELPACADDAAWDCVERRDPEVLILRLSWPTGALSVQGGGLVFQTSGATPGRGTVEIRG